MQHGNLQMWVLVKETTKQTTSGPRRPRQLVASAKTWSHLRAVHHETAPTTGTPGKGVDQIFRNDPCTSKPATPMQTSSHGSLDPTWQRYLDQKIDHKLAKAAPKPPPAAHEGDIHMEDARLTKLEKDMQELQRVTATQSSETKALKQEVQGVAKEMQNVKESFATELQKQLADQMQQLAQLVQK